MNRLIRKPVVPLSLGFIICLAACNDGGEQATGGDSDSATSGGSMATTGMMSTATTAATEDSSAGSSSTSAADSTGGLVCDDPPAPECVDGQTLRTYGSPGSAQENACVYTFDEEVCPDVCEAGACIETVCVSCEPEVFAMDQDGASGLALDDEHAYWTTIVSATVGRRLKTGGEVEVFVDDGIGDTREVVLDGTDVYWTNATFNGDYVGTLRSRAKSGGATSTIADNEDEMYGVALDDEYIYWATDLEVKRRAKAGGDTDTLATVAGRLGAVAVDATHVYWADIIGTRIQRVAKAGGEPETLSEAETNGAPSIALSDTHVYWPANVTGEIWRVSKRGGEAELLASEQPQPDGIALSDTHVYWTNPMGNTVARAPLEGGLVQVVASEQDSANHVALDATHVYWTTYMGDTVMRLELDAICGCSG